VSTSVSVHGSGGRSDGRKRQIPMVQHVTRRLVPRKDFAELLRCPGRSRMRRDGDMDHAPLVGEHDEDEQQATDGGWRGGAEQCASQA